jgi:phenylacetate-coenzyme A ligase PaaK-like adenylate-forming protein
MESKLEYILKSAAGVSITFEIVEPGRISRAESKAVRVLKR